MEVIMQLHVSVLDSKSNTFHALDTPSIWSVDAT